MANLIGNKRKQRKPAIKSRQAIALEKDLFGDESALLLPPTKKAKILNDNDSDNELQLNNDNNSDIDGDKPVWHDSDDDELEIDVSNVRKNRKYRKDFDETIIDGKTYIERRREQLSGLKCVIVLGYGYPYTRDFVF